MASKKQSFKSASSAGKEITVPAIKTEKRSLVEPSSSMLDMHLQELEEECARFVALITALRSMAAAPEWADEELRATTQGNLYASISHLTHHAKPALDEMDRLLDEMPDDEEDD
jgi:cell division septum initiation protein DivIVA